MRYITTICDKTTGDVVGQGEGEARKHGTDYQANVSYGPLFKVGYGNTEEEAIQAALAAFVTIPRISGYNVAIRHA